MPGKTNKASVDVVGLTTTPVAAPKRSAAKKRTKQAKNPVRKSPAAKTVKNKAAAVASASPRIPRVAKENEHSHPPYLTMIKGALTKLHDRKGNSLHALQKQIASEYNIELNRNVKKHLSVALKKGLDSGVLVQLSGVGLNGRFRLASSSAKASHTTKSTPKGPKPPVLKQLTIEDQYHVVLSPGASPSNDPLHPPNARLVTKGPDEIRAVIAANKAAYQKALKAFEKKEGTSSTANS